MQVIDCPSHESVGGEPVPRLADPVYPRGWEVCALIRGVQSRAGDGGDTFCTKSGLQVNPVILAESFSNGPRFVAVKKWRYGDKASWSADCVGKSRLNGVRDKV